MKILSYLFLLLCPLFAQNSGSELVGFGSETFDKGAEGYYYYEDEFNYVIIRNPDGSKTFYFSVNYCAYYEPKLSGLGANALIFPEAIKCKPEFQSAALAMAPVQAAIADFLNDGSDAPHKIVYLKSSLGTRLAEAPKPRAASALAAPPANAHMILLDNMSVDRIIKLDLTTFAIVNQVTFPNQAPQVFGVRPSTTGETNEVWTAPGATVTGVSISDLGAGKMIATIPNPSLGPNAIKPAGIVFANDGSTALYAVGYFTPDSSGNNGSVVSFDAVNRKVISTLQLKFAPETILMAPDGLTAYLIGGGKISYYDVLSGTADLTVSFPFFSGQVFIHPDGTRLFWDAGQLEVFDLTTRKIVNEFKFGLPSTSGTSMQMSQDGSKVYVGNGLGAVVTLDTRYGNVLASYQSIGPSQVFAGPPANQP